MQRVIATMPSTVASGTEDAPGSPGAQGLGAADDGVMRTEFAFELPRGYVGADGTVHRRGVMRLANLTRRVTDVLVLTNLLTVFDE